MTKTAKDVVIKAQTAAASAASTKDNGAVQVGGAAIRFASTKGPSPINRIAIVGRNRSAARTSVER